MRLCKPLPDEHARGHILRLQLLNALHDQSEIARRIRSRFDSRPCQEKQPLVDSLATLVGLDSKDYVRGHTFLPYWIFYQGRSLTNQGTRWSERSRIQDGLAIPTSSHSYCRVCAMEDVAQLGMSYWRRAHQVRGAVWCSHHGKPLLSCESKHLHSALPHHLIGHATRSRQRLRLSFTDGKPIRQYQQLAEIFLANRMVLSPDLAVSRLRNLVKEAFPNVTSHQRGVLLQHMAEQRFPSSWLDLTIRRANTNNLTTGQHWFQGIVQDSTDFNPTTEGCMIVLTLLFDSAEAGFQYLT